MDREQLIITAFAMNDIALSVHKWSESILKSLGYEAVEEEAEKEKRPLSQILVDEDRDEPLHGFPEEAGEEEVSATEEEDQEKEKEELLPPSKDPVMSQEDRAKLLRDLSENPLNLPPEIREKFKAISEFNLNMSTRSELIAFIKKHGLDTTTALNTSAIRKDLEFKIPDLVDRCLEEAYRKLLNNEPDVESTK